jgi:UDP-N-acetylmuramoyl-L-alanyl-D-glutamate--2,6-diaminopimelate ligase
MWQTFKNLYHLFSSIVAIVWFGNPARELTIIGVTGTDGKTTTCNLIYHILKESGKSVALISTIGAIINGKTYNTGFHVTTPDSFALQSYLKKAKEAGARYIVLEVTSHALDQNRAYGIPFRLGVLTNVTHEHLDYHKTYDKYLSAKVKLLHMTNTVILNKEDDSFEKVKKSLQKRVDSRMITYGIRVGDITKETFSALKTKLPGEYNMSNILASATACLELGLTKQEIVKAVATFASPKGRTEVVYQDNFSVMIDFAHTPNALKQLLTTLGKMKEGGRLIHIFGSAGERDKTKRPMMGEVSSSFADVIILTAEDPRSESVSDICQEIQKGIIKVGDVPEVIIRENRQEAIDYAISIAKKYDLIVITGKGHEESINYGKGEVAWTDHEGVKLALAKQYEA